MPKKPPAGTPAVVALTRAGVEFSLHPYEHDAGSTNYGDEAVAALGVPAARFFKTLLAEVDGSLAVGVLPVAAQLDLKALAGALGGKRAAMADPAAAERATGYVVGGISPLGQKRLLPAALDSSASGFDTVYVSAGRRGLAVQLSPADLAALTGAVLAEIARR